MLVRHSAQLLRTYKSTRKLLRALNTDQAGIDNHIKLANELRSRIKLTGPLTVADYMREVLTHSKYGYYMNRDMFGSKGDFVTSPEIGQIFGELVGIWFVFELDKINYFNELKPLQIIELGPGRATLSSDVLRVLGKLRPQICKYLSLHFVEVSPYLTKVQQETLDIENVTDLNEAYYQSGVTKNGLPVYWYRKIEDVPKDFSIVIAHEFLDALPIHKFKKTENGYREVLVDITPDEQNFQFVLSRTATPNSTVFVKRNESRDQIEVCPEALVLIEHLGTRFQNDGGIALIVDYGHQGEKNDTFRGFKNHSLHDPLIDPGSADLTADVDFSQLVATAEKNGKLITFGPVTQHYFLKTMGIDARLEMLLKRADVEQQRYLVHGYKFLVSREQMGERFKFLSLFPIGRQIDLAKHPVVGFS